MHENTLCLHKEFLQKKTRFIYVKKLGLLIYLRSKEFSCMRFYCFLGTFLFLAACGTEKIENFDAEQWKKDTKGCKSQRLILAEILEKQKEKLMGLSQSQIVNLLGKPDAQELLKRNAKTFTYYLSEGLQCGKGSQEGVALIIHFGALNYVSEISRSSYQ